MPEYRTGAHTVYDIQYHFVWATKYRYYVLRAEVAERARDLIRQVCMSRDISIVQGHVSVDHVHLLVSCPPALSPAKIIQYIKGVASRKLSHRDGSNHRKSFPICRSAIGDNTCGHAAISVQRWVRSPRSKFVNILKITNGSRLTRTFISTLNRLSVINLSRLQPMILQQALA
jgi:REP element-mobilizing transposase RayT